MLQHGPGGAGAGSVNFENSEVAKRRKFRQDRCCQKNSPGSSLHDGG